MSDRGAIRLVATLVAVACTGGLAIRGQAPSSEPLPQFRSEVRYVEVDAVVQDRSGTFVGDLTAEDFEILEDDRPQAIQSFRLVHLPIDQTGRPLVDAEPAPVATAPVTAVTSGELAADLGRVYVMVLDSGQVDRVKAIARLFIEQYLGPRDLMAVLHVGAAAHTQGLTSDREVLLQAVDRYRAAGPPCSGAVKGCPAFQALKDVAINLNAVSGRRKAILFVSNGARMWPEAPHGAEESRHIRDLWREYEEVTKTAARNNVRIYPIHPFGFASPYLGVNFAGQLNPFNPNALAESGMPRVQMEAFIRTGLDSGSALPSVPRPDPDGQSAMRLIAEDTGGRAIVNTNNFSGGFRNVVRDNSAYYVLGYYSPAERDGRFHRIRVRVHARPDLSVRGSRAGYEALTPDVKGRAARLPRGLSSAARAALQSPGDATTLPVELFTAVFQADNHEGSVLIGSQIPGAALRLGPQERIELSYVAVDRWGTIRAAERRGFALHLRPQSAAAISASGVRLFGRLRVPRGRYQIRVVAHQPGGATGSAVADVDVPDFADRALTISDLLVASTASRPFMTLEEDPLLRRALPAHPTTERRFHHTDTLTVFGEIYDSHWLLTQLVAGTMSITGPDGGVLFRDEQVLASRQRGRFHYTAHIPLARFAPGVYLLSIEASTRVGMPASASQQLPFEVTRDPDVTER